MTLVTSARFALAAAAALFRRPGLWATAVMQMCRFAAAGWWRRPPFLPLPTPELLRFRAEAMYGDPERAPAPGDVIAWLEWCRRQRMKF